MLQPKNFKEGMSEEQSVYVFDNELTGEKLQIIRNEKESQWFGLYENLKENKMFLIPVETSSNKNHILKDICDWYNEVEITGFRDIPTILPIQDILVNLDTKDSKQIREYIREASVILWDDISRIKMSDGKTLWQLVIKQDSSFPTIGKTINNKGKTIKDWSEIPSPLLIIKALKSIKLDK